MTESSFLEFRPRKLAELFDQAIRLYRRNFLQFIGIIAIPYIPLMLIQTFSAALVTSSMQGLVNDSSPFGFFTNGKYWLGLAGTFLFYILYLLLIQGLATAALTRAISDSYAGEPVGIFSSYRRLGASPGRLVGALLWLGLIGVGLSIIMIIPCIGWIFVPGIFVFLVAIVLPLVAPVVVLEDHGARASVRRAWDLGRTRFWWLIGYVLILYLFSSLIISGPTLLMSSALRYFTASSANPLNQQLTITTVIQTLITMITSLLYLPLQLSAITVVYFDLRVRSEGLDLALQSAPAVEHASLNVLAAAPSGPHPGIFTGKDIGNFILFTLGFFVLYALLIGIFFAVGMAFLPLFTPR